MEISAAQKSLIIKTIFEAIPDYQALYLFGSYATGHATQASDLDLAVLRPGRIEPTRLLELSNELARALLLPIDLIDLHQASTIMRYEILRQAQELVVTDSLGSTMIDDIKARGHIYG